eukprot:g2992.t1
MARQVVFLVLGLGVSCAAAAQNGVSSVVVYRAPHYATKVTKNVVYAQTLVNCAGWPNATLMNESTCTEADMVLDVWQPANTTDGPFPIVMSVHGGGFVSGDQTAANPPNSYFAARGFVAFAVQYRLAKDKGLFPAALKGWSPRNTRPSAGWTPWLWQTYPAVRDVKAALRWVHANAARYNADPSSLTLQGGSAGATAAIELALTGGADQLFAQDYTGELTGADRTLASTNLDQAATVTGLISYWGGIFAEDLMRFKDGAHRWSASSVPTVAFHGTADTTVAPTTGDVLCGNLTALGVPCRKVPLPGEAHACWNAKVGDQSIFDYAFETMANMSGWTVLAPPSPGPGGCAAAWKQCGGKNWAGPTCCDGACTCTGTEWHKQCRPPADGNKC